MNQSPAMAHFRLLAWLVAISAVLFAAVIGFGCVVLVALIWP